MYLIGSGELCKFAEYRYDQGNKALAGIGRRWAGYFKKRDPEGMRRMQKAEQNLFRAMEKQMAKDEERLGIKAVREQREREFAAQEEARRKEYEALKKRIADREKKFRESGEELKRGFQDFRNYKAPSVGTSKMKRVPPIDRGLSSAAKVGLGLGAAGLLGIGGLAAHHYLGNNDED